jgi:glycosyl transferase family 25
VKTFLINLDGSPDRLAHMRQEFSRVGVEFTRIPAVDGRNLDRDTLEDFAFRRVGVYPRRWLPGEIGCFLSHFAAWKRIAEGDDGFAAVFEDDVHLASDLRAMLTADDWIPADADVVRLEATQKMRIHEGRPIGVAPRRRIFRAGSATPGSAGYVMSRRAARRLVRVDLEFHCWSDVFLFHPGRSPIAESLTVFQVAPALCIQSPLTQGPSDALRSVIGEEGRALPPIYADAWTLLRSLLPWKKQLIEFRP